MGVVVLLVGGFAFTLIGAASGELDWIELIKTVGLGLVVLIYYQIQFQRGKIHTDLEFQREVDRAAKLDTKLDRVLDAQEEIVSVVKDAVSKRAEIKSLDDLAKLADYARDQGLIK